MAVHVEEMSSEVEVFDTSDLPLSDEQLEKLINIVMVRLEDKKREAKHISEATSLRSQAAPPSHGEE